jgi:hypothetical protein
VLIGVVAIGALWAGSLIARRFKYGFVDLVFGACRWSIFLYLAVEVLVTVSMSLLRVSGDMDGPARWTLVLTSGALVAWVLLYSRIQLDVLSRRSDPSSLRWLRDLSWIAGIAILVSIPVGELALPTGTWSPFAVEDILQALDRFFPLIVSATTLLAVFSFMAFAQAAFRQISWEEIVEPAGTTGASAATVNVGVARRRVGLEVAFLRIGLVLFAGYVIGAAGVFAIIPVPFLIAFFVFGRLILSPTSAQRLAEVASEIRNGRRALTRAFLRPPVPDEPGPGAPPPYIPPLARRVAEIGPALHVWGDAAFALKVAVRLVGGLFLLYLLQNPFGSVTFVDPYFAQRFGLSAISFGASWLVIAFFFGLMYEYLVGTSGLQKGMWLGVVILVLTVPFQLISALGGQVELSTIGLRTVQVFAFTVLLGAAFDLRLIRSAGLLHWSELKRVVTDLGTLAGAPQLTVALTFVATAILATLGALVTGQLTGLLTRALSPFLPLPVTPG